MSDLPPISGKAGLDTTDFKAALTEMNRDIRVLESGFKASAASLGDWTQSATGLEARIGSLTSEIGIQEKKVTALREEYERVAKEKGANSRAAEELEIKLNKEVETLGKMQVELSTNEKRLADLGQTADGTAGEMDTLAKSTDKSQTAMEGLGQLATGLGGALAVGALAVAGLAAAVIGLGKSIVDLVLDTSEAGAELYDLSLKTGISTDRLQEMAYIGDQVGTSADTMTGAMTRLVRSMSEAQLKADGDVAGAFTTLGVSATDASGKLRDNEAVFSDLLDALGKLPNEAERDALAMKLFGKSAQELNPLIKAGSDEMARLSQEAHDVGAVISGENIQSFADFQDSLDSLKAGFAGLMGSLAGGFMPIFQNVADVLKDVMANPKVQEGVRQLAAKIGELAQQFANFVASDEFSAWIQQAINWLLNDLPKAIQEASRMWREDLAPTIGELAVFLRDDFLPVARDVAAFLKDTLPPAIKALSVVLDVLLAGWKAQWWFLDTFILPIFRTIGDTLENLRKLWDMFGQKLLDGMERLRGLTGGLGGLGAGGAGGGATNTNNYNVTIQNSPQATGGVLQDIRLLQMLYGGTP